MNPQQQTPWMTPQSTGAQLDPLTHLLNLLTGFAFQSGMGGQGGLNADGSSSNSSQFRNGPGSNNNPARGGGLVVPPAEER